MTENHSEVVSEAATEAGEEQRLAALRRYALLDTPPEQAFDRLTKLACRIFDAPVAMVSLVDEDRQWFKSCVGVERRGTKRAASFCTHNIEHGAVMVIEDAAQDERFDENPLVHGESPQLRFYAGAPLTTHDGHFLGAFCVLDREPRSFSEDEKASLSDLAVMAMEEIELRRSLPRGSEAMYEDRALLSAVVSLQDEIANASLSLSETADLVARRACSIIGASGACLSEWDGSGGTIVHAALGLCDSEAYACDAEQRPAERALCRVAHESDQVIYANDVADDERASNRGREAGVRSVLVLPLHGGERTVGTLELLAKRPDAFEHKHIQALDLLVGPIEAALERARAEKALRESEREHRLLLAHLPVGVYRSTPEGRMIEVNAGLADILGYESPKALIEKNVADLYLDMEDRARHVGQLTADETRAGEFQLRGADGRVVWVRDYPRAITDEEGKIVYYDGVIVDVTERKQAEEQVAQSEARLRAIVNNVSDMIEVVGADGAVQHVSGDVETITGYAPEQVVGRPYYMNAHPDDYERVKGELPYLLDHRDETIEFEYRFRHQDGSWRYLSVRGRSFVDESESGGAFLGMVRDITERRLAEEQRAASESRLRGVVENIADVIEIVDEDATIQYVSGAIEALTGFEASTVQGETLFTRMHPDDQPGAKRKFRALLDQPGDVKEYEYRFRHRDGSWRYLSVRLRNFVGRPGIDGLLGTVRDVTEEKEFEKELVEAKEEAEELAQLKSTFLANMSHEIRTPLASILGFAEVLVEEADGEMREFAELIQQGGTRLSETLDSVLDLARLEAGGFEPDLEVLSLRTVMQDAAALFAPMAENKGITFDLDPPEKDVRLWADRTGVDRMLANLLSNAIKFTSEGSVTLSGKRTADAVEVRVADTGAGMDESFQEYLFDAFRQESSGLSRLYEGTGLGLTITRRLAEVMNVAISVETEKGEGSTFFLRFPKPERRARPSRMPDEPLPQFEIKLGRLLAVEDNDDTRRLLERLLSKNWTPTVVSTPAEALEAAAETAFDAVLLDINLGADLDGVDVMRRLRKDERYAEVPFVAVTAYAMPGDEEGFADVGFDAYLGKPFTQKELLRVLQQSAKEKR